MKEIREQIEKIFDEVVALRRDFHMYPEMSQKETRTSGIIAEKLREYGLDEVKENVTSFGTGVIGLLKGTAGPGKCIALRGDIDALPVTEDTGLPFASKNTGVMHACAHDGHAAMLLGTAKILTGMKDKLHGSVKFLFQPAEELAPDGGSRPMMAAGAMENPHVDAIVAGHIYPLNTFGATLLHKGGTTTGFDNYDIEFFGRGGHGSQPQNAIDAVLAACQFVVTVQQIASHSVDPLKTVIVGANVIEGGTARNIIPGYAKVQLCMRAYEGEILELSRREIGKIADGIAKLSGCEAKITYMPGYSPVHNDPGLVDLIEQACVETMGEDSVKYMSGPFSGSEDFGRFISDTGTPGALVFFEAGHLGDELQSLHNAKMTWREEVMKNGVTTLVATAVKYLEG